MLDLGRKLSAVFRMPVHWMAAASILITARRGALTVTAIISRHENRTERGDAPIDDAALGVGWGGALLPESAQGASTAASHSA